MHRRSCMPRRTTAACGAPRTAAGTVRRGLTGRFISDVTVDPVKRHVAVGRDKHRSLPQRQRRPNLEAAAQAQDRSVSVVAIAPSNRRFVYAGTYDRGLYRSWNGGRTWSRPDLRQLDTVTAIAVHPRRPRTLWVAAGGYVLRSA